jgi:hypothetical protein
MAERHGGMRRPQNPAPVSGPGQLSQRTDGGPQQTLADMSGMPYGENQAMDAIQSAAPLSASGQTSARASRRGGAGRQTASAAGMGGTPLMSPTQRPDEPVTAGAPFGPGPGPAPRIQEPAQPPLSSLFGRIAANDPTGDAMAMMSFLQRLGL